MTQYASVEHPDDKGFLFSCKTESEILVLGPCADGNCRHEDQQDAERCYHDWLYTQPIRSGALPDPMPCEHPGCDRESVRQWSIGHYHRAILCDLHGTSRGLEDTLGVIPEFEGPV